MAYWMRTGLRPPVASPGWARVTLSFSSPQRDLRFIFLLQSASSFRLVLSAINPLRKVSTLRLYLRYNGESRSKRKLENIKEILAGKNILLTSFFETYAKVSSPTFLARAICSTWSPLTATIEASSSTTMGRSSSADSKGETRKPAWVQNFFHTQHSLR